MLERIEAFLAQVPPGWAPIYFSGFFLIVTWLGILFVRPVLRFWFRRESSTNDLVAYASSGFSLFYGLLLGLLSVAAYQSTKDVDSSAS